MKSLKHWFTALLIFGLAACGSMGQVVTPQTPEQQIAAAFGLYTTLANSAADMVELGTISPEQAKAIQGKLLTIHSMLNHLRTVVAGGKPLPSTELETLQLVQKALIELQLELQKRTPNGPGNNVGSGASA